MTVLETEQLIPCDVDETLILWREPKLEDITVDFIDPFDGKVKVVVVHQTNLKVMMNHLARGTTIIVWSRSGYAWAKAALAALGVTHKNLIVAPKPIGYIDDKPCQEWMGEQIYLPVDSRWGL